MNDKVKEHKDIELELAGKIQKLSDFLENTESSEALNNRKQRKLGKRLERYKEELETIKEANKRLEYANSNLENKRKQGIIRGLKLTN